MYQAYESDRSVARQKPQLLPVVGILLGLWLSACSTLDNSANSGVDAKPNVVSTSTVINDWTAQIGGDEIELTGILQPGADPHVTNQCQKIVSLSRKQI
jgi:manganese/iron transport system substrate-binding protein